MVESRVVIMDIVITVIKIFNSGALVITMSIIIRSRRSRRCQGNSRKKLSLQWYLSVAEKAPGGGGEKLLPCIPLCWAGKTLQAYVFREGMR